MAATVSVTAWLEAAESRAVTVLLPPFSPMLGGVSTSVTLGVASSSVMVPVPVRAPSVVARVALVGVPSVTITVSFGSSRVSPLTGMVMVPVVEPAAMVTDLVTGSV